MSARCAVLVLLASAVGCRPAASDDPVVEQWTTHEITLTSEKVYPNPYTDVEVTVRFESDSGQRLVRPAFWDGGTSWKVRFAPPDANQRWTWRTEASVNDNGLAGRTGALRSSPYTGSNTLLRHGLLRMSPGKRNVVHADGTPFLVVADTAWSIPYRATREQVKTYARDRQAKGFNTTFLIAVQGDKFANGPDARDTPLGFRRAFTDIPDGHMRKLQPSYFQELDGLVDVLVDHGLVPLYAPAAHGYGWKGERPVGPALAPDEYVRFSRYLVARYGSMPAFWLVSLDSNGLAPSIKPAGEAIERWDAYRQPTGLHYSPYDDYMADWAKTGSDCCFHGNKSHQGEPWLDFQWAQTGHDGKSLFHKVQRMYDVTPVKAVMDGESTYEAMGQGRHGLGWWQGDDAWNQLMHGGTMGVAYGAVSVWQWKVSRDEPGWPDWTDAPLSWRDALDLEGGQYVGAISRAFRGYDSTDIERRWDLAEPQAPLLAKPGKLYVAYLPRGGAITIPSAPAGLPVRWFDAKAGAFGREPAMSTAGGQFSAPDDRPWGLFVGQPAAH
ncbi:MAG TPA: DUF4038 domain-containing protein [Luteitalea sp.]|nr:DUF4038 domain-containing protein [Luteitalea sp.]